MRTTFLFTALLCGCCLWALSAQAKADDSTRPGVMESPRQRVIVLTDVENEPDDTQSLIRLLLYSNNLDIKGIIATTSTHMRNRVAPETIFRLIEAYGKVHGNLLKHDAGYPSPEFLKSVVKAGLPRYGMNGVGKGKDSEGSEWIIRELKQPDERPLWITAWGGTNVLAQALYKMRETMPRREADRLIRKLRVYAISDQDDTGCRIREDFPDLFYIVSTGPYEDEPVVVSLAPTGVEGSSMYPITGTDTWVMIMDEYGEGRYFAQQTEDMEHFTKLRRSDYSFAVSPRHGSVVAITDAQYDALVSAFGRFETK